MFIKHHTKRFLRIRFWRLGFLLSYRTESRCIEWKFLSLWKLIFIELLLEIWSNWCVPYHLFVFDINVDNTIILSFSRDTNTFLKHSTDLWLIWHRSQNFNLSVSLFWYTFELPIISFFTSTRCCWTLSFVLKVSNVVISIRGFLVLFY